MSSLLRVLVAEDHPLMQEAIRRLLSPHCSVVGIIERGDAIADAVQTYQPDVVVLDVSMPGRSGMQVLAELRLHHPDLALLLLTTHDSKVYRDAASERGADGYVTKASAAGQLWPEIQRAAAHRAAVRLTRGKAAK